ncbi:hypothetical protein [Cyclobacterium sp.]|uniref:hypothetical protein n=1 Tax=Cyclobacterium sp. TaxID=1966343 RepID=UPI00199910C9|nr:hypothetical protein [Cyclobacterium sp.]MBD3628972.1 hypothetical protein [Cyclobacterium sp.]
MKTKKRTPDVLDEMQIDFPNLLVKTQHGNVYLKSMINNKRTILCINPSEIIPSNTAETKDFIGILKKLKDMNFHLIGFNRKSFREHLKSLNWVNSYIREELIFPIFYQAENEQKEYLEEKLSETNDLKNPVYFLDKNGTIKMILNGDKPDNRSLEKIMELASKLVLGEQSFQKDMVLRDN